MLRKCLGCGVLLCLLQACLHEPEEIKPDDVQVRGGALPNYLISWKEMSSDQLRYWGCDELGDCPWQLNDGILYDNDPTSYLGPALSSGYASNMEFISLYSHNGGVSGPSFLHESGFDGVEWSGDEAMGGPASFRTKYIPSVANLDGNPLAVFLKDEGSDTGTDTDDIYLTSYISIGASGYWDNPGAIVVSSVNLKSNVSPTLAINPNSTLTYLAFADEVTGGGEFKLYWRNAFNPFTATSVPSITTPNGVDRGIGMAVTDDNEVYIFYTTVSSDEIKYCIGTISSPSSSGAIGSWSSPEGFGMNVRTDKKITAFYDEENDIVGFVYSAPQAAGVGAGLILVSWRVGSGSWQTDPVNNFTDSAPAITTRL